MPVHFTEVHSYDSKHKQTINLVNRVVNGDLHNDERPSIVAPTTVNRSEHSDNKMSWLAGVKRAFRRGTSGSMFGKFSSSQMAVVGTAELVGTAILVFLGCMGVVVDMVEERHSHMQVALTFGLTVAAIIQIIGHISKAHINPAVTVCAVLLGDINLPTAAVYMFSQCLGATLGYGMLKAITPTSVLQKESNCKLCVTLPNAEMTSLQALLAETLVTSILIFLVCSVWDKRNGHNQDSAALKFGFTIGAIAMAEGHYTGASMNPARSLGPAIWTGIWTQHWVYWVGPIMSAVFTTLFYKYVFDREALKESEEEHDVPLATVKSGSKGEQLNEVDSKDDGVGM